MRRTGFLALAMLFASCATIDDETGARLAAQRRPAGQALYTSFDDRVDGLLARMTLDEKVGQMTQPDQEFLEDVDHVREYMVGSLLSGGGSDPATNSFEDWRALYEMYQSKALETRLRIPLLYGVDAAAAFATTARSCVLPWVVSA